MFTQYITAAMNQATYKILEDGTYYGEIPALQGVWANEPTLEGCRTQLQEVLEEWILLGLHLHHTMPIVDGIDLNPRIQEVA